MNANGEIRASIPDHSSGCTSFALDPTVTKNSPLSGQSKDGAGPLWDHYVVLDTQCVGQPRILELGYPGYLGLLGLSETGMSLFTNRIYDGVNTDGIPHIILKKLIWNCQAVDEVEGLLSRYGTAIAANFLVCDKNGQAASFELRGNEFARVEPADGILVHTNHYLLLSGREDTDAVDAVCSRQRRQRLLELLKRQKNGIGRDRIFEYYRDHRHHPNGICSHGPKRLNYGTTAVMTAEHTDLMLSVTAGRTCRARYTTYQMGSQDPVIMESGAPL
jgi:isopenicillin-N N-acyltransferase-like protein